MDEIMSGTLFDEELEAVWQDFLILSQHQGVELQTRLNRLIRLHKEALDDAAYMKLMYMKGISYEEQENKNAARYCAMRMRSIRECIQNPRKKRPRFLDIQGFSCDADMDSFIERYTDFLEDTYRGINHRLLLIVGVLFLIVFLVLVLVLKIYIVIAALEALMLGMLTYLLQKRRMPDIFQKNQLNAIEKYVEQEVLEFDRPIRFS